MGKINKTKVISGLILMISGILGIMFGKNIKDRAVRLTVITISTVSIGGGLYLFVDGLDDKAIGVVGQYKVNGPEIQPLVYQSKKAFQEGLAKAFHMQPEVRRLHFTCPDGSKELTIYNTHFGIMGEPEGNIICNDGFPLIKFKEL